VRIERTTDAEVFETSHPWLGEHNAQFVEWSCTQVWLAAYDDDGELAGSLNGEIYWGKLRVDNLVVRSDRRGRGDSGRPAAAGRGSRGCR